MPSSANGTAPTSSAAANSGQRESGSPADVDVSAAPTTSDAAAAANRSADATREPMRTRGETGSVRKKISHGDTLSAAIPTPNWKKTTPSTATAANPAITWSA